MINEIVGAGRREPGTPIPSLTGNALSKQEQGEIIAKTLVNPFSVYKIVSLRDEPVSFDTYLSGSDSDVRMTRGVYTISYTPRGKQHKYLISQDLVQGAFRVSGPRHFGCLCERIPELGWLKRNTTISDYLFDLAKRHPGLGFQFTIDWERYASKILEAARAKHIDIDNKQFVGFKCSYSDFDEKYRQKVIGPKRTVLDYKDVFKDVDKQFKED